MARRYWEIGMMVVADWESAFNDRAINNYDSSTGDPSVGTLRFVSRARHLD
ncbi:hypothetical protein KL864_26685 [Mycolicibacterium goodii]|uniref:hypothetical protein n=1 Tax=Mycolicibacterium goodii TaxID=134601 RepID=UPI001304669A|nr:hypothetical protein [Mycolicibacterium goodii]MBU8819480.1 hypothetical protein [Mycolicibacterium goodii]